jgi:hypothetical protein
MIEMTKFVHLFGMGRLGPTWFESSSHGLGFVDWVVTSASTSMGTTSFPSLMLTASDLPISSFPMGSYIVHSDPPMSGRKKARVATPVSTVGVKARSNAMLLMKHVVENTYKINVFLGRSDHTTTAVLLKFLNDLDRKVVEGAPSPPPPPLFFSSQDVHVIAAIGASKTSKKPFRMENTKAATRISWNSDFVPSPDN